MARFRVSQMISLEVTARDEDDALDKFEERVRSKITKVKGIEFEDIDVDGGD